MSIRILTHLIRNLIALSPEHEIRRPGRRNHPHGQFCPRRAVEHSPPL